MEDTNILWDKMIKGEEIDFDMEVMLFRMILDINERLNKIEDELNLN